MATITDKVIPQKVIDGYIERPSGKKEFVLTLGRRYRIYTQTDNGTLVEQLDYTPTQAVQDGNRLVALLKLVIDEQPIPKV
jgi:hypothetical protein